MLEIGRKTNKEVNNKLGKFQLILTSSDGSTYNHVVNMRIIVPNESKE